MVQYRLVVVLFVQTLVGEDVDSCTIRHLCWIINVSVYGRVNNCKYFSIYLSSINDHHQGRNNAINSGLAIAEEASVFDKDSKPDWKVRET